LWYYCAGQSVSAFKPVEYAGTKGLSSGITDKPWLAVDQTHVYHSISLYLI